MVFSKNKDSHVCFCVDLLLLVISWVLWDVMKLDTGDIDFVGCIDI